MVMDFWEAKRRARTLTTIYLGIFVFLTLITAAIAELTMRVFAGDSYNPPIPVFGLAFLGITFAVAAFNYLMYRTQGGSYVAESVGAVPANPNSRDPRERQLINIIQEMAIATSLPIPSIYIIPSHQINAFAAGLKQDNAAIAVTRGALEKLNRDELQGVIAHEFGHVDNGDMVLSLRLAAMIMGFFFILYVGLRLLQGSGSGGDREGRGTVFLIAFIFMIAGALSWFMGSIMKASVSRHREYLADASSVQYTRNPDGICNALRKIANDTERDMPPTGGAYAHMYFDDHSSIFASHPPIRKRIAAILGKEYISEE